jgi:hypothetical protein
MKKAGLLDRLFAYLPQIYAGRAGIFNPFSEAGRAMQRSSQSITAGKLL